MLLLLLEEEAINSKNGTGVSSKGDPIPPSSVIVVCSPSMRAVLLAHALALPDWVDQRIRHEVISVSVSVFVIDDDGDSDSDCNSGGDDDDDDDADSGILVYS